MELAKLTLDIYAYTNPAFGALVLFEFSTGFARSRISKSAEPARPAYPYFFLAYPILYTDIGSKSFKSTNISTGFFEWLDRHPEIRIDFAQEVRAGRPYARNALLFAVSHGLLKTDGWYFWPSEAPPWKKPSWKVKTDERGQMLSNARSLGAWMSQMDLPTLFQILGVRP